MSPKPLLKEAAAMITFNEGKKCPVRDEALSHYIATTNRDTECGCSARWRIKKPRRKGLFWSTKVELDDRTKAPAEEQNNPLPEPDKQVSRAAPPLTEAAVFQL
jgi:hypothetical protein